MLASFYCQELIRNSHLLCKGYINKLQEDQINHKPKHEFPETKDPLKQEGQNP